MQARARTDCRPRDCATHTQMRPFPQASTLSFRMSHGRLPTRSQCMQGARQAPVVPRTLPRLCLWSSRRLAFCHLSFSPPATHTRAAGLRVALSTAPPLLLPASLFTLQAGLNLYAATGLDAVTFQVSLDSLSLSTNSSPLSIFYSRRTAARAPQKQAR